MQPSNDTGGQSEPKIALALSGGGARAIAFHLGCLRALNDVGLLDRVTVISSVSGGSVLAALYCASPGDFSVFERKVKDVLARGLVWPAIKTACTTLEGIKAISAFIPILLDRCAAYLARQLLKLVRFPVSWQCRWLTESPFLRWASRTTILERTISELLGGLMLPELRSDRPRLIIVACELRAKAAFYFTANRIHCWRYGTADCADVEIAHAVAASASYPLALPSLDERIIFVRHDEKVRQRVTLTDGGVYDNLGLAPFWPDRDPRISLDVGAYDHIVACRAGYSLDVADPAAFVPSRMIAVFESVHARAQNLAVARLFDLQRAGRLPNILLPYLGQNDDRLAFPPSDLVRRENIVGYPTNFSAMSDEWIERLSLRGEQLVRALIAEHWPHVGIHSPDKNV